MKKSVTDQRRIGTTISSKPYINDSSIILARNVGDGDWRYAVSADPEEGPSSSSYPEHSVQIYMFSSGHPLAEIFSLEQALHSMKINTEAVNLNKNQLTLGTYWTLWKSVLDSTSRRRRFMLLKTSGSFKSTTPSHLRAIFFFTH